MDTKKLEEALQYYKSAIALLPGNVYCKKSNNSEYIWCNNNFAKILHLNNPADINGKTDYDFLEKILADVVTKNDAKVIRSKIPSSFEEKGLNINGEEVVYLTTKTPLLDDNHNVIGLLGISVDITERKTMEEELRIAKERAELASEIKSQFIQNMEHDLRTPAAGVYGLLNAIVDNVADQKLKDMMQKTTKASKRLLDFLNDIIAFDKYTSGQLPLVSHEFDLYDMLNGIIEMEMPTVHDKNIELKLDIDKDVPQHIISDKHRIFRIIINLIGNAVKFTKEGHVVVSVSIRKQIDSRRCLLKIVVEDTGIGIPADRIHRIYERFERCTPSNAGLYPGAGLGLSITKQFIEELQGDVNVESKEGEGTTFTCIIPCKIPLADIQNYESVFNALPIETKPEKEKSYATVFTKEPETEAEPKKEIKPVEKTNNKPIALLPKGTKVLLVEDDPMAQILADSTLKSVLHVSYDLAETGKAALELWSKNKYNFILMDLGLPDTKGYQVAQQIRKTDKDTVIIALTAHDEDKYKKLCFKAGMQGFLTKPINIDQLLDTLADIQNTKTKTIIEEPHLVEPEIVVDEKEFFDMKICIQNATGSEAVAQVMIMLFMRQLPEYLTEFEEHHNNKDIESMGSLALKLKGASITIGAAKLAELAENLQQVTEFKKITIDDIEEPYKKVCAAIAETLRVVKKFSK